MCANVAAVTNVAKFAVISLVALINDAAVAAVKVAAAAAISLVLVNDAAVAVSQCCCYSVNDAVFTSLLQLK